MAKIKKEEVVKTKTGECRFFDEQGNLSLAESFVDEKGSVSTEIKILEAHTEPEER